MSTLLGLLLFLLSSTSAYLLGGSFPLTGNSAGPQRSRFFELGIEDINANATWGFNFTYIIINDLNSERGGLLTALNFSETAGVIGVVGAASSTVSKIEAEVFRIFGIPQISYASTNAVLSDKSSYPYFSRTVPPDPYQANALIEICRTYGWAEVGLLYSSALYAQSIAAEFQSAAEASGLLISAVNAYTEASQTSIDNALNNILTSRVKVVVWASGNSGGDAVMVVSSAKNRGLLDAGYGWLIPDALSQAAVFGSNLSLAAGLIGLRPATGSGPLWTDFQTNRWPSISSQYSGGLTEINTYSPYAYDAVFAFAYAVRYALDHGLTLTGGNLTDSLANISFLGLTGPVGFDSSGDRLGAALKVVNFNGTAVNSVGDCALGGACSFTVDPVFPGETYTPPNTTRPVESSDPNTVVIVQSLSEGALIAIIVLAIVAVGAAVSFLIYFLRKRKRAELEPNYELLAISPARKEALEQAIINFAGMKVKNPKKVLGRFEGAVNLGGTTGGAQLATRLYLQHRESRVAIDFVDSTFSRHPKEVVSLLLDILRIELEDTLPNKPGLLFREDSCFTIAFARYAMLVGMPFIWRLLHSLIANLQSDDVSAAGELDLEIDPNKNEELHQSVLRLKIFSGQLLLAISTSHKEIPLPLVDLCRKIWAVVVAVMPEAKRNHVAIGNLIFLRFFSKALVLAEEWGMVTKGMTSRLRRNLLLLSKVLLASANGETFEKENFMAVLNPVLEDYRAPMKEFYHQLLKGRNIASADVKKFNYSVALSAAIRQACLRDLIYLSRSLLSSDESISNSSTAVTRDRGEVNVTKTSVSSASPSPSSSSSSSSSPSSSSSRQAIEAAGDVALLDADAHEDE